MQYRKVIKLGGSLYVGIPSALRDALDIHAGDILQVSLSRFMLQMKKDATVKKMHEFISETRKMRGGEENG